METRDENYLLILDGLYPLYVVVSSIELSYVQIGQRVLVTAEVITFVAIPMIEVMVVVDVRTAQTEYHRL